VQGVDFFFGNRAHALKFIAFVQSVVPMRYRADKQLVSHNEHSATYNYKYTFSVEIVPICRASHPLMLARPDAAWRCGKDRQCMLRIALFFRAILPRLLQQDVGCFLCRADHANC
jgi:hypothetical protein